MARVALAACVFAGLRDAVAFQPALGNAAAAAGEHCHISRGVATSCGSQSSVVQRLAPNAAGSGTRSAPWGVMSAMLLGSVALISRRRSRRRTTPVARLVTAEQIENLTLEDIPDGWRPFISVGMSRRYELKEAIKKVLDRTFFIFAFNYDGLEPLQMEELRAAFPPQVTVRCVKNALVRKAMEGTDWINFAPAMKGSNCYVFVHEDVDLKGALEAWLKMERKFNRVAAIEKLAVKHKYDFELRSCIGGIMLDEFEYIDPKELPKFKDLPTRIDLIARIAGGIKQVTQKIAVGINQVPKKLAVGTKKITEKMEDEGMATVAEAVA